MFPLLMVLLGLLVGFGAYFWKKKKGLRTLDPEISQRPTSALLGATLRDFALFLTDPVLARLERKQVTPTQLNIAGMVFGALAGLFFFFRFYSWGAIWLMLSGGCDLLDGRLARKTQVASKAGAFLDATMDRLGEGFAFIGLLLSSRDFTFQWTVSMALLGSFLVSYVRAKGEAFGAPTQEGFMQRPERLAIWITWTLLASFMVRVAHFTFEGWLSLGFLIIAVGAWWTVVHRIRLVHRMLSP